MEHTPLKATDLSGLHDAELCLVSMNRATASLRLEFKNIDQSTSKISFDGVLTYRINNIQYQHVISRIIVSGVTPDFGGDLEKTARWTCSGSSNELLIPEKNLQNHVGRILSGNLILFYVEPSWGAEIGVIAEAINMSSDAGS